jgi:hypothetical protein
MSRTLIIAGLVLLAAGLFIHFGGRLPLRLGRLPGDIRLQGRNSSFYFPVVTCLLLSVLLSLALWMFKR